MVLRVLLKDNQNIQEVKRKGGILVVLNRSLGRPGSQASEAIRAAPMALPTS